MQESSKASTLVGIHSLMEDGTQEYLQLLKTVQTEISPFLLTLEMFYYNVAEKETTIKLARGGRLNYRTVVE